MIFFDEHKRMHIVDETGWWEPKMIPQLLSELYGAIAAGTEDGLSYHETAMFLQLLLPTGRQMTDMFAHPEETTETKKNAQTLCQTKKSSHLCSVNSYSLHDSVGHSVKCSPTAGMFRQYRRTAPTIILSTLRQLCSS